MRRITGVAASGGAGKEGVTNAEGSCVLCSDSWGRLVRLHLTVMLRASVHVCSVKQRQVGTASSEAG